MPADYEIYRWWQAGGKRSGMTRAEIARRMGITEKALDSKLYRGRLEAELRGKFPDLPLIQNQTPWVLQGDRIVVGDVHVPYTDYGFAGLVAETARYYGIRKLLIGGDFFNMDKFSTYTEVVEMPTWDQERTAAHDLLSEWLEWFEEIEMILGNHDRRLQKFTSGAFSEKDILALVYSNPERVKLSVYGYCTIYSGGVKWRVTHPKAYSTNRLTTANDLAMKYDANIISFHEHFLAKGYTRYQRKVLINGGCLIRDDVPYAILDDTKAADWNRGFVVLKDGVGIPFGEEPFTDWGFLNDQGGY